MTKYTIDLELTPTAPLSLETTRWAPQAPRRFLTLTKVSPVTIGEWIREGDTH